MTIKHEVTIVRYSDNEELELEWLVVYSVFGKDYPATWESPAEYAELEIIEVRLESVKCFYIIKGEVHSSFIPIDLVNKELLEKTLPSDDEIEAICWADVDQRNKAWEN